VTTPNASLNEKETKPKRERRAARRIPIEVEIGLATETNFFTGFSEDLSDGGLFIATYQPLKVDTRLELTIRLPESEDIKAQGRVVWLREALDHAPAGVGVALEGLSDGDHSRILEFVRVRAPLFYDL
jgi:uncharacterized protein (TIGR02266 family)